MRYRHCLAMLPAIAASLAWPIDAVGQEHETRDTEDGYAVEFADSDLLGYSLGLEGYRIQVRDPFLRVLLIRPRASFVTELQKSVEHM